MVSLSYVLTGLALIASAISVSEDQPLDEAPNNQTLSIPKRFIVEFNEVRNTNNFCTTRTTTLTTIL
jgi:hypothetical protein